MIRINDKHIIPLIFGVVSITEMIITKQSPDTAWLFFAYGCYKIIIKLIDE